MITITKPQPVVRHAHPQHRRPRHQPGRSSAPAAPAARSPATVPSVAPIANEIGTAKIASSSVFTSAPPTSSDTGRRVATRQPEIPVRRTPHPVHELHWQRLVEAVRASSRPRSSPPFASGGSTVCNGSPGAMIHQHETNQAHPERDRKGVDQPPQDGLGHRPSARPIGCGYFVHRDRRQVLEPALRLHEPLAPSATAPAGSGRAPPR